MWLVLRRSQIHLRESNTMGEEESRSQHSIRLLNFVSEESKFYLEPTRSSKQTLRPRIQSHTFYLFSISSILDLLFQSLCYYFLMAPNVQGVRLINNWLNLKEYGVRDLKTALPKEIGPSMRLPFILPFSFIIMPVFWWLKWPYIFV